MLPADPVDHRLAGRQGGRGRQPRIAGNELRRLHMPVDEIHRRRADEGGDELVDRIVVEIERGAYLLDPTTVQHHDLVGHGHRFDLVVGDVDRGGLQLLVQRLDLAAHYHAQLGVEVRQRLVEKEHLGVAHNGAAHRDPLALPAGELTGAAFEIGLEAEDSGGPIDPLLDLGLRGAAVMQRKAHVVRDRHVRIERVVLKHHGNVTLLGLEIIDHFVADHDLAAADGLQLRQHPQQRGLAAARGADEDDELAVGDVDLDAVDHMDRAIGFLHVREGYLGHGISLSVRYGPVLRRTDAGR